MDKKAYMKYEYGNWENYREYLMRKFNVGVLEATQEARKAFGISSIGRPSKNKIKSKKMARKKAVRKYSKKRVRKTKKLVPLSVFKKLSSSAKKAIIKAAKRLK